MKLRTNNSKICFLFCFFVMYLFFQHVKGQILEAGYFNEIDNANYNDNNIDTMFNILFNFTPYSIGKHISINENNKSQKKKNRNINNIDDMLILTNILSQLIPVNFSFTQTIVKNDDNKSYQETTITTYHSDDNIPFLDLANIYYDDVDFHETLNFHLNKAEPIKGCEEDIKNHKCDKTNILKCISLKKKELSMGCKNALNDTLLYSCIDDVTYYCKDTSLFSKIYNCLKKNFYFLSNNCANSFSYYEAVVKELQKKNISKKNKLKEDISDIHSSEFYNFIEEPTTNEKNLIKSDTDKDKDKNKNKDKNSVKENVKNSGKRVNLKTLPQNTQATLSSGIRNSMLRNANSISEQLVKGKYNLTGKCGPDCWWEFLIYCVSSLALLITVFAVFSVAKNYIEKIQEQIITNPEGNNMYRQKEQLNRNASIKSGVITDSDSV